MRRKFVKFSRRALVMIIAGAALLWATDLAHKAYAQSQKKAERKQENYSRPKPVEIKPTIPSANRYQEDKVFLENADSLYRPQMAFNEEMQIVKGNVKFRQGGLWMFCDSAYYYPEKNSLDAFGHVRMEQGDTLFVYSDKLYYDGYNRKAILTHGPSQKKVKLKDRKVTLTTDSLDYDMVGELGWYTLGGTLEDDVNTLTSQYGQYSPNTKRAEFRTDVLLVNNRDGYKMYTEDLVYYTSTSIAEINTSTRIEGANDTILTSKGLYNTKADTAQLLSRSTIIHRDSAMNVTTLEGDSIIYDKPSRVSRAYMFKSPWQHPQPMVLTDTARKMILIGGYGEYNDSTKSAFSTIYPLLMEFSRPDTLFLRADTILTYIRTELVFPENYRRELPAEKRAQLAALGSLQAIADLMQLELKVTPDLKVEIVPDSPSADVDVDPENEGWNDSLPVDETIVEDEIKEMPEEPADTVGEVRDEEIIADTIVAHARLDSLGRDSSMMVLREFHVAKAYYRARFFNKDIQGIADSLEYQEFDSMLYLHTKPIIWSGERQVMGRKINVHFNDSTVDWAYLPEYGIMSEYVDEDFYNQLAGDRMTATFENDELKKLYVDGSVETIFLPMENDSTYNRLINAQSSYMTVDLDSAQLQTLKMWPEVSGTVTPLFMIKKSQMWLEGFRPYDNLRPVREWYEDGTVKWADNLGEIPDDLNEYFNQKETRRMPVVVSPFEKKAETPPASPADSESRGEEENTESSTADDIPEAGPENKDPEPTSEVTVDPEPSGGTLPEEESNEEANE